MNDFKQIYLRETNITDDVKNIIVSVMKKNNISTASKAIIQIVESFPLLTNEIAALKKQMALHIGEKHDLANKLEKIQRSMKKINFLNQELEEEKQKLLFLSEDES